METFGTLLERKAAENKGKTYLYFLDQEISYRDMDASANRAAVAPSLANRKQSF